jgi:hypothetical protein
MMACVRNPSLTDWLTLSSAERIKWLSRWNPYAGEGGELIKAVSDRFRAEFGHLPGLEVSGPGVYHGGSWVIAASHPFVFDRRKLPNQFLGVDVHASLRHPMPPEFEGQQYPEAYVWAAPNFERFVDRCGEEIRRQLSDPHMTRAEMLHALIGRPFDEHLADCRRWVSEGKIPPFE